MNLRKLANSRTRRINRNVKAVWRKSTGYTTSEDGTRVPVFADTDIMINPQAVAAKFQHIEGLNIEGVSRSVYIDANNIMGPVRPDVRGGDFLVFAQYPGREAQAWKVLDIMETWPAWSHVIAVLDQNE